MRIILVATLAALTLPACKPPKAKLDQSSGKTLENLAAGYTVRVNVCRENPADKPNPNPLAQRIKIDPALAAQHPDVVPALTEALRAVPVEAQEYLLDKYRGFIEITADANRLCSARHAQPGPDFVPEDMRKKMRGCYEEVAGPKNGQGPQVRVLFMPDADSISHNAVRIFGYMFDQYYSRRLPTGELAPEQNPNWIAFKSELARDYIRDVLRLKLFNLKSLEPIMGEGMADVVAASYAQDPHADPLRQVSFVYPGESTSLTPEQRQKRESWLVSWIFGDAYDSYFCRPFSAPTGSDTAAATELADRKALSTLLDRAASNPPANKIDLTRMLTTTLQSVTNTRLIFETLFPATYCHFEEVGVPQIELLLRGETQERAKTASCKLYPSRGFGLASSSEVFSMILPLLASFLQRGMMPQYPNQNYNQNYNQNNNQNYNNQNYNNQNFQRPNPLQSMGQVYDSSSSNCIGSS